MNKWMNFTYDEYNKKQSNIPFYKANTERKCPVCNNISLRFYYREINFARKIGTIWYWCYNCFKYTHSTIIPISDRFLYNEPIELDIDKIEFMQKNNTWISYLNSLWNSGKLPQIFEEIKKD